MVDRSAGMAAGLGGFVAGTIDIGAASLISGKSIPFILQFIAGGLLGLPAAFAGGAATAVAGLLLQLAMSVVIAAVFVGVSLRRPQLRRRWVVAGLAYGVIVYAVMNYVVMPLSRIGHAPKFAPVSFAENMAAMLVFGLIVAGVARWRMGDEMAGARGHHGPVQLLS